MKIDIELEENLKEIEKKCLKRNGKNNLIELSIDNIWKVNAMLKENSRYTIDKNEDMIPPDSKFVNCYLKQFIYNSKKFKEKDKKKTCGSTSWWAKQLKNLSDNDEESYKIIIAGLIHDIDRMNSTHLNADKNKNKNKKNGRYLVFEMITENYKNKTELINALMDEDKMPLIKLISQKNDNGKINFSFATKFCHYLSWNYLNDNNKDMYSIYDDVVSNSLPMYLETYKDNQEILDYFEDTRKKLENFNENITKKYFNNDKTVNENFYKKFFSEPFYKKSDNEEATVIFYQIYRNAIDKIREISSEDGKLISRNAFDHLLWYGNKKNRKNELKEKTLKEILEEASSSM